MLRRILLGLFSLISFCHSTLGQRQYVELPVQFSTLIPSFSLLNPSYAAIDQGVNITAGNQMHFGSFNIFRTHYLNATAQIKKRRDSTEVTKNHGIGLTLYTDRDGEYIQHNRFYLTYAYRISLTDKVSLAAGASVGAANISIESSSISPPGSSLRPDANVGMWLQGKKSFIGISFNQIMNSQLRPLQETIRLRPYFNITAGKSYNVSPIIKYIISLNVRTASGYKTDVDFNHMLLVQGILSMGINYRHHKGLAIFAGLKDIRFANGKHLASGWFTYNVPFSNYVINNLNAYEITLSYKIF